MNKLAKVASALPAHVAKDTVVLRLQEAEKALGVAVGIDQVRLIMGVAAAQEVFAKRQKLGEAVIGQAHALKFHAITKLAELIEALVKAPGTRGRLPAGPTLAELGIDKKTANLGRQLLKLPAAAREAVAQRETTIAKERRKLKAVALSKTVRLPDAKYRVLYADPPWATTATKSAPRTVGSIEPSTSSARIVTTPKSGSFGTSLDVETCNHSNAANSP